MSRLSLKEKISDIKLPLKLRLICPNRMENLVHICMGIIMHLYLNMHILPICISTSFTHPNVEWDVLCNELQINKFFRSGKVCLSQNEPLDAK